MFMKFVKRINELIEFHFFLSCVFVLFFSVVVVICVLHVVADGIIFAPFIKFSFIKIRVFWVQFSNSLVLRFEADVCLSRDLPSVSAVQRESC